MGGIFSLPMFLGASHSIFVCFFLFKIEGSDLTYLDILNQFNGLKKTQLEPKFEVCNSKNTDFGIMVLGFDLKYADLTFKCHVR